MRSGLVYICPSECWSGCETDLVYMRKAYIMKHDPLPFSSAVPSSGPTRPLRGLLAFLDVQRLANIRFAGFAVLRYGLVFLLFAGGAVKFAAFEAEGIRPFIEHSPFMSWMYSVLSIRAASGIIGVVELALGMGIVLRRWFPLVSGIASLGAVLMFLITWSFFFTTPGAMAPESEVGGFLMKDLILLGAALTLAAEALGTARERAASGSSSASSVPL